MPLVHVNEILKHATENKYGVAAINTIDIKSIEYAIKAAENEKVPIIVQFYPGLAGYTPLKYVAFCACDMARNASVPVAVHLDHSPTFEIAVGGIRDGFPSVMVDGSAKPYEENVALTKSVVEVAKIWGVDVEAELGHVGSGASIDDITNSAHYTDVDQAVKFVEETGCGSLAVAVGNAHGPYVKTPKLDFDRIKALHENVKVPLVLHGCSDIPDEQMQEAVNLGMSKFNVATENFRAYYNAMKAGVESGKYTGGVTGLLASCEDAMVDFAISKIRLLNPNKFSL